MTEEENDMTVGYVAQDGTDQTSPWLTQREAAEYLKVSTETIRRAVVTGQLKRYGTGKGGRFLKSDLDEFQLSRP